MVGVDIVPSFGNAEGKRRYTDSEFTFLLSASWHYRTLFKKTETRSSGLFQENWSTILKCKAALYCTCERVCLADQSFHSADTVGILGLENTQHCVIEELVARLWIWLLSGLVASYCNHKVSRMPEVKNSTIYVPINAHLSMLQLMPTWSDEKVKDVARGRVMCPIEKLLPWHLVVSLLQELVSVRAATWDLTYIQIARYKSWHTNLEE